MNTSSTDQQSVVSGQMSVVKPFRWSVWREVWENHSIYIAPLVVAGIILFGSFVGAFHLPELRRNALLLEPALQRAAIERAYDVAAMMLIFTAFIAGLFYSLDALHGERRDRSILFWKSLPVSDLTSVLSKATIPLLVLPVVTFAIIVATHFVMLLISTVALTPSGLAGTTFANFNIFKQSFILAYGLIAIALWHAPIYGWALLVSGWARRATFLWAVLPLLAIGFFEKITFGTAHFAAMLKERLLGFAPEAFAFNTHMVESATITPGKYLSSSGLWLGLLFAAVFIAIAVRLRRYRGPL
jgi:ABC-2 type transport system permease protein